MHLYKAIEWENGGRWYVNDTSALGTDACRWWTPMKILGMEFEEYTEMLKTTFKAGRIHYFAERDVLVFSFDTQADARKFKNFINKEARLKHYMC